MNRREAMKHLAGMAATAAAANSLAAEETTFTTTIPGTASDATPGAPPQDVNKAPAQYGACTNRKPVAHQVGGLECWLETSLQRIYPTSVGAEASPYAALSPSRPLTLKAARNYRLSFQVAFRNLLPSSARVKCEVTGPDGLEVKVRRVGFVPMQALDTFTPFAELEGVGKMPGLCPDPLYPDVLAHIGPEGTGVFWVSLFVPEVAQPGSHKGTVKLTLEDRFGYSGWDNPGATVIELPFEVQVGNLVVQRRKDFPVTIWISADSIWEYYKVAPFSDRFWKLAEAYIKNQIDHGVDVAYVPVFNIRDEKLVRPAQLLMVRRTAPDTYEMDFANVRRWIQIAKKHGANFYEFSHFFSPAPHSAANPQKIYELVDDKFGEYLWPADTPATSDTYRKFLEQFIPAFKKVLEEEGVLEKCLFHLADEPDGKVAVDHYRAARQLLREVAPWMKVMDAMSEPHYATERLSDMPVPSIVTYNQFKAAGCPSWAYYCCGPRAGYIQRLLDTPLTKIRTSGWLFYKLGTLGFLHWGFNYWFKFCTDQIADPFQDATNGAWPGMPYGDTFAVYPGAEGPLDSIRWEVLSESLQDYALLQSAGIKPDDPMLAELKDFDKFPKEADWIHSVLEKVLGR